MDEADAEFSSRVEAELARLRQLYDSVRAHQQRRDEGADQLDVDIAVVLEMRRFLVDFAGVSLPSDAFLLALSDGQDGKSAPYLKRKQSQRPVLAQRQILIGNVAHLVETVIVVAKCRVGEAAERVAKALNTAKVRPPQRLQFKARRVEDWHAVVVHRAKTGDLTRGVFEREQRELAERHPGYTAWGSAELRQWLASICNAMAKSWVSGSGS
jgi:hypothetical protein